MTKGFVGKAANSYLRSVTSAMNNAKTAHNKKPFSNSSAGRVSLPGFPECNNIEPPYPDVTMMTGDHIVGIGNSDNVVAGRSEYDAILRQIDQIDETFGRELYNIAMEIEGLLEIDFILPLATTKCRSITTGVKDSMGSFRSLTEDCQMNMRTYVNEILNIGA